MIKGNDKSRSIGRRISFNTVAYMILAVSAIMLPGCSLLQKIGILSAPVVEVVEPVPEPIPLEEQPYTLNLRIVASADLNPNAQSQPSPIQVRVFVMQPQADIIGKGFEEVFDYSGNVMDPRPLATLTLQPNQIRDIALPANKSQTMLAVAAAYLDPYQSIWKATAMIEPTDQAKASANIGATTVTISPGP